MTSEKMKKIDAVAIRIAIGAAVVLPILVLGATIG